MFFCSKGMTLQQNVHHIITKVVFSISSRVIQIQLYPKKPSIKEKSDFLAVLSTRCLCEAKKNYPLGLPNSNPYNQHTILLFVFLGIETIFAIHYECLTISRDIALYQFLTSSFIFKSFFDFIFLKFYWTGLHSGFKGNLCSTIFVLNPDMS